MKALQDLEIFVRTSEMGSISAAARQLDLTPAAASSALKRLEAELGTPLFVRSTRSLRLTAQGAIFLEHCRQALELIAVGREAVIADSHVISGTLQLSLPSDLGRNQLLGWIDEFQSLHPDINLRIQVSDRIADVYRQPIDLAIRYGALPDSNLIAFTLAAKNRRVLCASPDYLARAGRPATPQELTGHNCLCYMLGEYVHDRWLFYHDGAELSVSVKGNRVSDDGDAVHRWVLAGYGIAYKSIYDVAADIRAGRLIRLCPDWQGEAAPLHFICADRRQHNPAVQRLRTFLSERLAAINIVDLV